MPTLPPRSKSPRLHSLPAAFALALASMALLPTGTAHAAQVAFTSGTWSTLAQASAGAVTDGPDAATTDATPLPLASSASVPDTGAGSASATATAEAAHLAAGSNATAGTGTAQAIGVATFLGDFVSSGSAFTLSLDFGSTSDTNGAGAGTLLVTLFIDGTPVYEDVITSGGIFNRAFSTTAGSLGALELTLNSETIASAGTNGGNQSDLRFAILEGGTVVPAPSTLPLALFALACGLLLASPGVKARHRAYR